MTHKQGPRRALGMVVVLVGGLGAADGSFGQCDPEQTDKLPGENESDLHKHASASGDTILVGAPGADDRLGAAYVYDRTEEGWVQTAKLTPELRDTGDLFGYDVVLSCDTAVISAYLDDDNGINAGAVYVFDRTEDDWIQTAKLLADDGTEGEIFGKSVSFSGDVIAVGATWDDDGGGEGAGAMYIFERTDGVWRQTAKLTARDGGERHWMSRVSVSGRTAVAGAYGHDGQGEHTGAAYVFEPVHGTWAQIAKLTADAPESGDAFGLGISISGDTIVVGAVGDDGGRGAAYVFERTAGEWPQTAKLTPDERDSADGFGRFLGSSGDVAVIGANQDDERGMDAGAAYVFLRQDGGWTQERKLAPEDLGLRDSFGFTTSVTSDIAVIGSRNDAGGYFSGAVYVFALHCPIACAADFDSDGAVGFDDLCILLATWGPCDGNCIADLDDDGVIGFGDLLMLLSLWGVCS